MNTIGKRGMERFLAMFNLSTALRICSLLAVSLAVPLQDNNDNEVFPPTTIQKSRTYNELIMFETALFIVGSAFMAFLTFYLPLQVCFFFGNCRKSMELYRKSWKDVDSVGDGSKIRIRRNMKYVEPILVAILDTFVETELENATQNSDNLDKANANSVLQYPHSEQLLVTMAKYFDKYADKDVKRHVRAILFFLVHILGKLYAIFQSLIRFLVENRWL